MKRWGSIFLAGILLVMCLQMARPSVYASTKVEGERAIAIVFDNSGSMYNEGDQAWCRATYAMEVFASMLNTGDVLQIYPMHSITVDGKEYTMQKPLQITDAAQALSIRDIYTQNAGGTPIESIDYAVTGLETVQADKKYLVILTDGGIFSKNGYDLSKERTKMELDKRIQANAGKNMTVMYLGIGTEACIPNTKTSEDFVKKQAVETTEVLSTLTDLCNLIFGRDVLPKQYVSSGEIRFDISVSKLLVFVQGDSITDLKVKSADGEPVGRLIRSQQTKYSTKGASNYESVADTSLQGMMVTYEDCTAGNYTVEYSGTATSVEVYYEPDADLEFIFTDANGNNVDLNALYEGEYKVSFGLKDAKTGELISSDLLGNPHYEGRYSINGEETAFAHDGYNGEVPISLQMNDTFEADLTVTYLSGYTISKDSTDFGWPEGGVKVLAPPLGKFRAELKIPQNYIWVRELGKSEAMTVDLTIDGRKLTQEEFDAVRLTVDSGGIDHTITPNAGESQFLIQLRPTDGISAGSYQVRTEANYLDVAGREAKTTDTGNVTLSRLPLWAWWGIGLVALLLLAWLIWAILHQRVLPRRIQTTRKLSSMVYDGDEVTRFANFLAERKGRNLKIQSQYAGRKFGLSMDVEAGKESYLYKPQKRRSAMVKATSVKKFGVARIQEAMIGSVKYVAEETTGKLVSALPNQKPFTLTNGMMVKFSGTIQDAGIEKDFEVTSKLNFKKK